LTISDQSITKDAFTRGLPHYIAIGESAAVLNCDPKTLRKAIAVGDLKAIRTGTKSPGSIRDNRRYRIHIADIAAWTCENVKERDRVERQLAMACAELRELGELR